MRRALGDGMGHARAPQRGAALPSFFFLCVARLFTRHSRGSAASGGRAGRRATPLAASRRPMPSHRSIADATGLELPPPTHPTHTTTFPIALPALLRATATTNPSRTSSMRRRSPAAVASCNRPCDAARVRASPEAGGEGGGPGAPRTHGACKVDGMGATPAGTRLRPRARVPTHAPRFSRAAPLRAARSCEAHADPRSVRCPRRWQRALEARGWDAANLASSRGTQRPLGWPLPHRDESNNIAWTR